MDSGIASAADVALAEEYEALAGVQSAAGLGLHAPPMGANDADRLAAPPTINESAVLIGLIGDIATTAAEGREVSPVGVAAAVMTWLGCDYGRDVYLPIGDTRHHGRLNMVHIGRSSRAAKGESLSLLRRIRPEIASNGEQGVSVLGHFHDGGLSTREGLVALIHDGYTQGKEEVPPVRDKRLLVVEEELANVLAQGRREGNTLLPALRTAYDGHSLAPATKTNRIAATDPHVCIIGAITPGELVSRLDAREALGGTYNRFLWVWAERTCLVPLPPATDVATVIALAKRCREAIEWARGNYPLVADTRQASLSEEARRTWEDAYADLRRPLPGDILAAVGERRATIAMRVALVYALTDRALVIDERHIRAGIEWARYSGESAHYVLAQFRPAEDGEAAKKLIAYLAQQSGWVSRSSITRQCYRGHISSAELDKVLQSLLDDRRIERREKRHPTNPKVGTEYRAIRASNANNANSHAHQPPDDSRAARISANQNDGGTSDDPRCSRASHGLRSSEPSKDGDARDVRDIRAGDAGVVEVPL
jgi:hypothetical protein